MLFIIISGFATALNIILIIHKFRTKRYLDAILDMSIYIFLNIVFIGTITGMSVGNIASVILSAYLWFKPVQLKKNLNK